MPEEKKHISIFPPTHGGIVGIMGEDRFNALISALEANGQDCEHNHEDTLPPSEGVISYLEIPEPNRKEGASPVSWQDAQDKIYLKELTNLLRRYHKALYTLNHRAREQKKMHPKLVWKELLNENRIRLFIKKAFHWSGTMEGYHFWEEIHYAWQAICDDIRKAVGPNK